MPYRAEIFVASKDATHVGGCSKRRRAYRRMYRYRNVCLWFCFASRAGQPPVLWRRRTGMLCLWLNFSVHGVRHSESFQCSSSSHTHDHFWGFCNFAEWM